LVLAECPVNPALVLILILVSKIGVVMGDDVPGAFVSSTPTPDWVGAVQDGLLSYYNARWYYYAPVLHSYNHVGYPASLTGYYGDDGWCPGDFCVDSSGVPVNESKIEVCDPEVFRNALILLNTPTSGSA
jgi:hypothetical protein